jgi:hypothetical protein
MEDVKWTEKDLPMDIHKDLGEVFHRLADVGDRLGEVRDKLVEASTSGNALAASLNRLTFWGVFIGGAGVIVAAIALFVK